MKTPQVPNKRFWMLAAASAVTICGIVSCGPRSPSSGSPAPSQGTAAPTHEATGGQDAGGGDTSEIEFKDIASNLAGWIRSGNADVLAMPSGLKLESYKSAMLEVLANFNVTFTSAAIIVDGEEKTCRNFKSATENKIECNVERFAQAAKEGANKTYQIVHHEFAGLVRAEKNNGAQSDYSISNQISAFLRYEVVQRLPIKPVASPILSRSQLDNIEVAVLSTPPIFSVSQVNARAKLGQSINFSDGNGGWATVPSVLTLNYDPLGSSNHAYALAEEHLVKAGVPGIAKQYLRITKIKNDALMPLVVFKMKVMPPNTLRISFEPLLPSDPEDSSYVDLSLSSDGTVKILGVHLQKVPLEAPRYPFPTN